MRNFLFSVFLLFCATLSAGILTDQPYHGPTEMLIKRDSWPTIEKALKKRNISKELFDYFNAISFHEDWGHIGYHGANHSFRVYQDVIKLTLEEILGIKIRKDFHFLRVPGDPDLNLNSIDEFFDYWGEDQINNRDSIRAKQLLSMNFGIYSNYNISGSCSVCFFIKDKSANEIDYGKMLEPFFESLGINPQAIPNLFKIADKWLKDKRGVLLQISENSHLDDPGHEAYNFADGELYPSERGGYRHGSDLISIHYQNVMTPDYLDHQIDIAPQIRLLINTRYTLNPYSSLVIKRWDLNSESHVKPYEKEMRSYIKKMKYDKKKVKKYKNNLLAEWI